MFMIAGLPFDRHYVCIYFTIINSSWNTNEKSGSIREYISKYLATRKAISKKIPLDRRWQGWPEKN